MVDTKIDAIVIDSHCHLDLEVFLDDLNSTVARAKHAGVKRFLIPGLTIKQFNRLLFLSDEYDCFDIGLGLHPYYLNNLERKSFNDVFDLLSELAQKYKNKYVAIGECGLDRVIDVDFDIQLQVIEKHIELATEHGKPLIVHHRKSHNELIALFKHLSYTNGGVIHAFSGSYETAKTYLDLGFHLGVGGTITYQRSRKTQNALKRVPLSTLLLETDSPDMPVCGYQGKRNEPKRLPLIADSLASLLGTDSQTISDITTANYFRLFSLSEKR